MLFQKCYVLHALVLKLGITGFLSGSGLGELTARKRRAAEQLTNTVAQRNERPLKRIEPPTPMATTLSRAHRADPWLSGQAALSGGPQKVIPEIEIKLP